MNRIDRRKFLLGAGGSALAIPLLESLGMRRAFGAGATAPKRFILVRHNHGRVVGNGQLINGTRQDLWSPRATTGPLPMGLSPLLSPLEAVRSELVTIDGIDNVVRHGGSGSSTVDGHYFPTRTSLTCVLPNGDGSLAGPSIDFVAGQRLRANAAMPASILINADSGNCSNSEPFGGANGTPPNVVNACGDPADAIRRIFQNVGPITPPPAPSLRDRLVSGRRSALDALLGDFAAMKARVSARDQARLDQHLTFIRELEQRTAQTPVASPAQGCSPLNPADVPPRASEYSYSAANDDISVPIVMETIVQALACDVTRSIACDFGSDVPTFDFLFPNGSPYLGETWHARIHGAPELSDAPVPELGQTYRFFASMFTLLIQRLAAVTDVDGSRLLDNTLVLWVSDLGYGATHSCFNYPVIFAGMKGAFAQGQGRHLAVTGRASLGDLYAQTLRMLGGTDQTFGATGTLSSLVGARNHRENCGADFCSDMGFPGYIGPDTPLHSGPLDL